MPCRENWSHLMHSAIVLADAIGSQLYHWIFSPLFLQFLVTLLFAILFPITSAAIINYLERKVMAWMQDRKGPLHVGPHGSLQLLADIGKMFTKEDVHAAQTDKAIFLLAPSAFIAPVIASFAVLPFSPFLGLPGTALATGIIYLVAMSSLDVIGVVMAGCGANDLLRITTRAGPCWRCDVDKRPCRFARLCRECEHRHHLSQRDHDLPEHLEGYRHWHPGLHLQRLYAMGVVHPGPAIDAPHLLRLRPRGDEPRSLRSPRGRSGTGRRVSHRI